MSVTYIVCGQLGLDTGGETVPYAGRAKRRA